MGTKGPVIKAQMADAPSSDSAVGKLNAALQTVQTIQGLLDPPYAMKKLTLLAEMSSCLNQHIEAISTNVDQFGWKYEPAIKLDAPDNKDKVKEAIYCEKIADAGVSGEDTETVSEPTAKEVNERLKKLQLLSKVELNKLKSFFTVVYPDGSFIELRSKTRKDLEVTGNAFWEILRDKAGRISRIVLAPVIYMRLTPIDKSPTEIKERVPKSDISWEEVKQVRYFRKFAEVSNDQKKVKAYFKEFGDPRLISRLTGKEYKDIKEFDADKDRPKNDVPATEILHFTLYSAFSDPYGVPRWIGNLPAVLGSRELDEVNLGYFENKTVPPLALLVAGGRLAKGVVPRIEEFIEQNLKGRKNFHKILILEAEGQKGVGATSTVVPTVKFVPLREAQQQDALFQDYDEANWQKIGSSFRLPRILVGRDRQINRATATASLRFAEEQVFEPIRNTFDELINRKIFADLNITFWRFRSNTPITRDPEILAAILKDLSDSGIITPAEGRVFASDVFNRELATSDAFWTKQPYHLTLVEAKKSGFPVDGLPDLIATGEETKGEPPPNGGKSATRDALARQAADDVPEEPPAKPKKTKDKVKKSFDGLTALGPEDDDV